MRYLVILLFLSGSLYGMENVNPLNPWQFPRPAAVGALARAIEAGDEKEAAELISKGHTPSSYEYNEPIWFAFELKDAAKRESMVKLLLENGVNPNGEVGAKYNPECGVCSMMPLLFRAVRGKCLAETAWLLAYGADPKAQNAYGETTLHEAVTEYRSAKRYFKPASLERAESIIKLLLLSRVDPQAKDSFGHTVAWLLSDDDPLQAMFKDFDACLKKEPKAFENHRIFLDEMRIYREFKSKVKNFGWLNTLNGMCQFKRGNRTVSPILPGYQTPPKRAEKRKRSEQLPPAPHKPAPRALFKEPRS